MDFITSILFLIFATAAAGIFMAIERRSRRLQRTQRIGQVIAGAPSHPGDDCPKSPAQRALDRRFALARARRGLSRLLFGHESVGSVYRELRRWDSDFDSVHRQFGAALAGGPGNRRVWL